MKPIKIRHSLMHEPTNIEAITIHVVPNNLKTLRFYLENFGSNIFPKYRPLYWDIKLKVSLMLEKV